MKARGWWVVFLLGFWGQSLFAQAQPDLTIARNRLAEGMNLLYMEQMDSALASFRRTAVWLEPCSATDCADLYLEAIGRMAYAVARLKSPIIRFDSLRQVVQAKGLNNRSGVAILDYAEGLNCWMKQDIKQAQTIYLSAWQKQAQSPDEFQNEKVSVALGLAQCAINLGYYREAMDWFGRAQTLQAKVVQTDAQPRNRLKLAYIYREMGAQYLKSSAYDSAYYWLSAAKKCYRSLPEFRVQALPVYQSLAAWHSLNQNYNRAIDYLNLAQYDPLFVRVQDESSGNLYSLYGRSYLGLQEKKIALQYFRRAVEAEKKKKIVNKNQLTSALTSMATCYRELDSLTAAQKTYEQAQALLAVDSVPKNETIYLYLNLGRLSAEINGTEAETYYRKALELQQKLLPGRRPFTGYLWQALALSYEQRNEHRRALETLQQAVWHYSADEFDPTDWKFVPRNPSTRDGNGFLETLIIRIRLLTRFKTNADSTLALETARFAARLIQQLKSTLKEPGDRLLLAEHSKTLYQLTVPLAIRFGLAELAFEWSEANKYAVFFKTYFEIQQLKNAGLSPAILSRYLKLQADIQGLRSQLLQTPDVDSLKRLIYKNLVEMDSVQDEIEERNRTLLENSLPATKTADIRARLEQDSLSRITLEYFATGSEICIFVVSREGVKVVVQPAGNLEQLKKQYIGGLRQVSPYDYIAAAGPLYRLLIQPVEKYLQSADVLYLVPDETLARLPFDAFLRSASLAEDLKWKELYRALGKPAYQKLPYLALRFRMETLLSAYSLFSTQPRDWDLKWVGVAPVFDQPAKIKNVKLEPLKASGYETENIARLFPAEQTLVLEREQATRACLNRPEIRRARWLHLSSHAFENFPAYREAGIVFHPEKPNGEAGWLGATEAATLELNAELVSLSGCETGGGKEAKGEGLIGLPRSMLLSGAGSALASYWALEDSAAAAWMKEFYTLLAQNNNISIDAAVYQVKRNFILQKAIYSAPYYWSVFYLTKR